MITETQAKLIAHALHEIRPAWGIDATMKVLERNADHPAQFGEVLAACVMAALDPDTQTPGRVFQIQTHWPEPVKPRLPKPPMCQDHPESEAPTCRGCHADVKVGHRPETHIGKHWEQPATMYEKLKATTMPQPRKNETITVTSAVGANETPNPEPPATTPPVPTATEHPLSQVGTGNVGSDAP